MEDLNLNSMLKISPQIVQYINDSCNSLRLKKSCSEKKNITHSCHEKRYYLRQTHPWWA